MTTHSYSGSNCLYEVLAKITTPNGLVISEYNRIPFNHSCVDKGECSKTSPTCVGSPKPSRSIHAEIVAIAKASKYNVSLRGATMYVSYKPCLPCLKAMIAFGLEYVQYRDENQDLVKISVQDAYNAFFQDH